MAFYKMALTAGADGSVNADTIMDILNAITGTFSVSTIVAFIAGILGVSVTFVLLWWGIKKGTKAIIAAATKGRFRL